MDKKDFRSIPFRTMVALGESHVAGQYATDKAHRWVNIVAELITQYQGIPVVLFNKGIGANAISPRSPGYASSAKPSALERYHEDVIRLKPDLFVLSYGLNDMRAGMAPEDFRQDMEQIIMDVGQVCSPVTVLTTVYYMTAYDLYPPYDRGSIAASEVFNLIIRQLADKHECILADIWAAEGRTDWLIHPDTVHANDLGHHLIANRVFEAIVTHCSGVALRVSQELSQAQIEVVRTMTERRKPQNYGGH